MSCTKSFSSLPTLTGCPDNEELIFVANAIGGWKKNGGERGFGFRTWEDWVACLSEDFAPFLKTIYSADFSDATHYNSSDIVGKVEKIFWNDLNRFLTDNGSEWVETDTGIEILVPGFDATTGDYTLVLFLNAPAGEDSGGGGETVVQEHTTGSTVTINNSTTWLIVNPAATIAALNITFPLNADPSRDIIISFGGTISGGGTVVTALTLTPNTGFTILQDSTPSILYAGEDISYKLNSSIWYRLN